MRYVGSNGTATPGIATHFDKTKHAAGMRKLTGLYIAKVIDITDDRYEGFMNVEIIGEGYKGEIETWKLEKSMLE